MNPDQKTAKKIGEVLAFTQVGMEIFQKGEKALVTVLGQDSVTLVQETLKRQNETIAQLVGKTENEESVKTKSKATAQKLRAMQDLYLQDQWDDATEIFEWLGFFEGAAIVHWSLVEKKTASVEDKVWIDLMDSGKNFHQSLFNQIVSKIT